jgi:hypothetical protein
VPVSVRFISARRSILADRALHVEPRASWSILRQTMGDAWGGLVRDPPLAGTSPQPGVPLIHKEVDPVDEPAEASVDIPLAAASFDAAPYQ